MSRRFWRFVIIALLGSIVVALFLERFAVNTLEQQLVEQGAEDHEMLARALSNSMQPQLVALVRRGSAPGVDSQALRASPEVAEFRRLIAGRLEDLGIVRLKIYSRTGLTVFSSDTQAIGVDQSANQGLLNASTGVPISGIVHKGALNTFDHTIGHSDLMQSYLPLRNKADSIIGVFEIYSDVGPLLGRLREAQHRFLFVNFGILGLFGVGLVALYARADRAVKHEQAAKQEYLKAVETSRASLEREVAERTRELQSSYSFLRSVMDSVSDELVVIGPDCL